MASREDNLLTQRGWKVFQQNQSTPLSPKNVGNPERKIILEIHDHGHSYKDDVHQIQQNVYTVPFLKAMSEEHAQTHEIEFLHQNGEDAQIEDLTQKNCRQGLLSAESEITNFSIQLVPLNTINTFGNSY